MAGGDGVDVELFEVAVELEVVGAGNAENGVDAVAAQGRQNGIAGVAAGLGGFTGTVGE